MKDYLVNIKYIQSTNMIIKAINKKDAIYKVNDVLNNIDLSNKIFDNEPFFKYKATRKKINKKSRMQN